MGYLLEVSVGLLFHFVGGGGLSSGPPTPTCTCTCTTGGIDVEAYTRRLGSDSARRCVRVCMKMCKRVCYFRGCVILEGCVRVFEGK